MQLPDAVRTAIDHQLLGLHTAMPAEVVEYDPEKQQARVQPLIKRRYADGLVETMPQIHAVPVIFPRTAAASLTLKVAKGDTVLVVCCERSIERWAQHGGEQEPGKPRHHALTDAVALVGLWPFSSTSPGADNADFLLQAGDVEVRAQDGTLTLKSGDVTATLDGSLFTLTGVAAAELTDGTARFKVQGGKIAAGTDAAELLDLLSQFMQQVATGTCAIGSPISTAANIAALKVQLETIRGTL